MKLYSVSASGAQLIKQKPKLCRCGAQLGGLHVQSSDPYSTSQLWVLRVGYVSNPNQTSILILRLIRPVGLVVFAELEKSIVVESLFQLGVGFQSHFESFGLES